MGYLSSGGARTNTKLAPVGHFDRLAKNMGARMPEGVTTFVRIKFVNLKLTITLQRPCHVPQHAIDLCPNTERNVRRKEKLTILGRKKLTILVVEVRDLSSSISASVQKSRVIYSER